MSVANQYKLPVNLDQVVAIYGKESPAHREDPRQINAIDFLFAARDHYEPKNIRILAAASGTVVRVKSDATDGGPDVSLNDPGNYLLIEHGNGEYSYYAHLGSITVVLGQEIELGEKIGGSGNTGYCLSSHLHFAIIKDPYGELETLEVLPQLLNDSIIEKLGPILKARYASD